MSAITVSKTRRIIDDFAREIEKRKTSSNKPSKTVINFRNEFVDRHERDIVKVPINLLRFRKDNGRIASDVFDYENTNGPLDESDEDTQILLKKFLKSKDPEKTEILIKNILHSGQRQPAIITCDGFLIDGNRRKMVLEHLIDEYQDDEKFQFMNVVILPGNEDEGGPPTLLEIEKLENRYQLQSEGKSEYYGFDRALSIRRKIEIGLELKDQISDDPLYANATKPQIEKAMKDIEKDYLNPLKCIDRYLKQFKRKKQYHTVSSGIGDKEGRWQAFVDYSNAYDTKLLNERYRLENNVDEEEIGDIEEAAFDIIRLRNVPDMPKAHQIMRDLPKYCKNSDCKKELLEISKKVSPTLPIDEQFEDKDRRKPLSRETIDIKWAAKNKEPITFHLKRAHSYWTAQKEKETAIDLLEAALKKLRHDNMDLSLIKTEDHKKARELTTDIQDEAKALEKEIYNMQKKLKRLVKNR